MSIKSLSRSSLLSFQTYSSMQAGQGRGPLVVEYVVVGGGAGAGQRRGGGGGAGGYRSSVIGESSGAGNTAEPALPLELNTNYAVKVGAGSSGMPANSYASNPANGTGSHFHTIKTVGGGAGASISSANPPSAGAGGGGAGAWGSSSGSGTPVDGALGTNLQGFKGGNNAYGGNPNNGGGGGGGAGSVGGNAGGSTGGAGGAGVPSFITGTEVIRAWGGVGAGFNNMGSAAAGSQGSSYGRSAGVNTGGGGNSNMELNSRFTQRSSGSGGSGVVILKYPAGYTLSAGPGLTVTTNSVAVPGYKITTISAGEDTVSFS